MSPYKPIYRLWLNEERTVMVRIWESGTVEVATRETPDGSWGPPIRMVEDKF